MADFLTADLPGTGGILRQTPEDFAVEEIPLYPPCGEGEHLYLEVEKRGLTTHELVRQLARACRVREQEIGYAGLKDARALTRQQVSLQGVDAGAVAGLEIPGVRILSVSRHRNKLRLGHLAGNRFNIRVHGVGPDAADQARQVLAVLARRGVPNLFGPQRYGVLGNNPRIGAALLRGDHDQALYWLLGEPQQIDNPRWREGVELYHAGDLEGACRVLPSGCRNERNVLRALAQGKAPRKALQQLPRPVLRLFLSAWQSQLFDRLVVERLDRLDTLEEGDLACKHANGACFLVEDPAAEQERLQRLEISPSAPLFGAKTPFAEGAPGARERELLAAEQLPAEAFNLPGGLSLSGERRPMRVPLHAPTAEARGGALEVGFELPRGSFATTVLREIMKCDAALGGE